MARRKHHDGTCPKCGDPVRRKPNGYYEPYCKRCINLSLYRMSKGDYERMLADQDGRCYICKRLPDGKRLAVDHDRGCCPSRQSCGKCVRALLCSNCNTALGLVGDDIDVLRRMVEYLASYSLRLS